MEKKKRYSNLTDQQLLEGIGTCYYNAQNHYKNAIFNSENFGLGIALFILSIEELIKANAIFHCYLGLGEQETIDITFNAKDKHRTRLKMALVLSSFYQITEKFDFIDSIERKVRNADLQVNINSISDLMDPKWHASLYDQIRPLIEEDIENITSLSKEIESELEQHTNWFLHAQSTKEKGLYSNLVNNRWESPLNLRKEDYEAAHEHTKPIIQQVGKPIRKMVEASELERNILRSMMKQYIEMSKSDNNRSSSSIS